METAVEQISNKIPLTPELVAEFKGYQRNIRDNTVAMASRAFDIRSQHLSADGRKYDRNSKSGGRITNSILYPAVDQILQNGHRQARH